MSFFKKLFGGSEQQVAAPPPPAPRKKHLVVVPETDAEWAAMKIADPIRAELLPVIAALTPRHDPSLQAAREARRPPSGEITMEEMDGDTFSTPLSGRELVSKETIAALRPEIESGDPFPVLLYPQYNGERDAEEGLLVFHVAHGGIGFLPSDFSLYNTLFLNLELRSGLYASCHGRIDATDGLTFHINLASYGVCYNRCQRILHARNAGAEYTDYE